MAQSVATVAREQVDAAIKQAALDYVYGWYGGDAARMERSLHPELAKRIVRPNDSPSSAWPPGDRLDELSALHLVQLTPRDPVPAQERGGTEVWILDRFEHAASVKIFGDDGDYAHMAHWNGRWVIVNVLWGLRPRAKTSSAAIPNHEQGDGDDAAITRTALDYIEGWYDGDASRMERSLHPELAKRIVIPSATAPGDRLEQMSALTLVQLTRHSPTPAHERRTEVTILHHVENAASVRVDASTWIDYMHLARWNGRWAIVNVLWERRPTARAS